MRAGHAVIAILATLLGSLPAAWASHTCDALGRRVAASIDGATTRYYRDGRREIEERDGTDARKRYHINGGLYVDERVASYEDAGGQFRYYLAGDQFTVVGSGDANGANIVRYPAGALGDFVCETPVACNGCATPSTCPGDANGDGCVDNSDLGILLAGYGT
ncbi:MAG TPA: hypothetical protein PKC49_13975, partial [Phycisphaerae bacterium]|nr:hypothetical protein [Phycisphaerae bacterium]